MPFSEPFPLFPGGSNLLWVSQRCSAEGTGGVNVQMLRKTPLMKHVATLRSLWPMDGTEADGAGIGHLKHAIGPFLPVAPIQHDLRPTFPGASLGPMPVQACAPNCQFGLQSQSTRLR
ncbi:hypothetical protein TNIN_332041 [Trichonephila inaurata madagascariensis]|uniref:Uncharacterized protein n=1 Tax=Trichonephila inaurata madagascariensis TaxID=2747483 RepID=A0A8X6I823_9ARAC|nr:hypothetical protein TNIN_332041 [Trichonephila inaurata madagascariensis]